MRAIHLTACVAALIAGAADARSREVPAATPNGKPLDCVNLQDIRDTQVRSDQVIDFTMRNKKVYRNTLPGTCPQLGFEERFAYSTSLSKLCSTDTITVLQTPGISRGATCGLGQFQPVTIAPSR